MSSIPDARALEALRRDGEAAMARLDRHCIDVAVYWKQADDLDDPSRSMRFSDACLVGEALETVRGLLPNPGEACDDVGLRVAAADLRGKAAAVSSQLRMRRDPLGRALHTAFDRDSHACVEALEALLAAVAEIEESLLSSAERRLVASLPVLRTGEERYELFCAVCGRTAVAFEVGAHLEGDQPSLLCRGIVWQQSFSMSHARPMFECLERGAVAEAHAYLIDTGECYEGIDAYCPDCDRVYCKMHYRCQDEYDDGFYDYTQGTCPTGHRRRVAD